jgi:hypothetical protein
VVAHGRKVIAHCNDEATARRLAQWPVMLEALKGVRRIIGQDSATMAEQTAVLRMMREAIAAAEGDAR